MVRTNIHVNVCVLTAIKPRYCTSALLLVPTAFSGPSIILESLAGSFVAYSATSGQNGACMHNIWLFWEPKKTWKPFKIMKWNNPIIPKASRWAPSATARAQAEKAFPCFQPHWWTSSSNMLLHWFFIIPVPRPISPLHSAQMCAANLCFLLKRPH